MKAEKLSVSLSPAASVSELAQFAAVASQQNFHTLGSPNLITEPKAEGPIQFPLLKNSSVTEHNPCLLLVGFFAFLTLRMP